MGKTTNKSGWSTFTVTHKGGRVKSRWEVPNWLVKQEFYHGLPRSCEQDPYSQKKRQRLQKLLLRKWIQFRTDIEIVV